MAHKVVTGKNKLWFAFQGADQLVKDEILLELKKRGLYRHWYSSACKTSYNLLKPQAPLRDLFLELLPSTAPLFGLPPIKTASPKKTKPVAVHDGTLNLFEQ